MKSNPKVSVIMSVYNGGKYLRGAIDSILNQTFKDFEFIIVNDGSTDNTEEILNTYSDKRLKIITQEKMGLAKSLNKAIKISKGKYIARMDADDLSLPKRLELQVAFLDKHKNVGLIGTAFSYINGDGKILLTVSMPADNEIIQKRLLKENCFVHGSVMIGREVLEKVGYYREEFKCSQDYDLFLRIAKHYKVGNLKEVLYKWRLHKEAVTITRLWEQQRYAIFARREARKGERNQKKQLQNEKEKFVNIKQTSNKIYSGRSEHQTLAKFHQVYGTIYLLERRPKKARYQFLIAVKYNFWDVNNYVYFCLTYLPFSVIQVLRFLKRQIEEIIIF